MRTTLSPLRGWSILISQTHGLRRGLKSCAALRLNARPPVASSCDFDGVTCPEATGMQPPKKVTEKTEGPIFQSPPESLPPANILPRGPANFPGRGVYAKTRPDRSPPGPCIVAGLRCDPD